MHLAQQATLETRDAKHEPRSRAEQRTIWLAEAAAEAAASLALGEGEASGLDFYVDHGRVHVGDLATTSEDAFNAWVSDRAAGLDPIMIAPPATWSPN